MDAPLNVAVVRSDNRRGAVAQALALIAGEIRGCAAGRVVVKPNLVSYKYQLPSTHTDTLSAALDAVFAAGAAEVTVAEGATNATEGFARFGYYSEAWGRPVRFFDINRDETEWDRVELAGVDGTLRSARLSRTIAAADFRVSLALAKTHVTSIVTLSLKNMLSSIHPSDRILMHGYQGGNGYVGWKRAVVEFLKQDNMLVNRLTRIAGRVRWAKAVIEGKDRPDAWDRLKPKELAYLKSVNAMNHNLVSLNRRVKPHLSVVDGFVGMHREGPRHGTPIKLGTVIAGTDPVAVDAVAAAVMGFDPRTIGYLVYAQEAGLGVADLDRITILGDSIASVKKRCVPHSNDVVQRHWHRLRPASSPAPHISLASVERVAST